MHWKISLCTAAGRNTRSLVDRGYEGGGAQCFIHGLRHTHSRVIKPLNCVQGHGAMNILLTGINHKTAPVEMRELLAIEPGRLTEATRVLRSVPGVEEAMILSTCNRVEVLASHRANCPDLLGFLGDYLGANTSALRQHVYELHGIDAVQHLFRVGSSLDSW